MCNSDVRLNLSLSQFLISMICQGKIAGKQHKESSTDAARFIQTKTLSVISEYQYKHL